MVPNHHLRFTLARTVLKYPRIRLAAPPISIALHEPVIFASPDGLDTFWYHTGTRDVGNKR